MISMQRAWTFYFCHAMSMESLPPLFEQPANEVLVIKALWKKQKDLVLITMGQTRYARFYEISLTSIIIGNFYTEHSITLYRRILILVEKKKKTGERKR